ncbi:hypothetical protein D1872_248920 [compost metagenome]
MLWCRDNCAPFVSGCVIILGLLRIAAFYPNQSRIIPTQLLRKLSNDAVSFVKIRGLIIFQPHRRKSVLIQNAADVSRPVINQVGLKHWNCCILIKGLIYLAYPHRSSWQLLYLI